MGACMCMHVHGCVRVHACTHRTTWLYLWCMPVCACVRACVCACVCARMCGHVHAVRVVCTGREHAVHQLGQRLRPPCSLQRAALWTHDSQRMRAPVRARAHRIPDTRRAWSSREGPGRPHACERHRIQECMFVYVGARVLDGGQGKHFLRPTLVSCARARVRARAIVRAWMVVKMSMASGEKSRSRSSPKAALLSQLSQAPHRWKEARSPKKPGGGGAWWWGGGGECMRWCACCDVHAAHARVLRRAHP